MAEFDGGETGDEPSGKPARFCHSCGTNLSEPVGRFCQSCGADIGSGSATRTVPEASERSGFAAQQPAPDSEQALEVPGDSGGEPPSAPKPPAGKRSRWWVFALIAVVAVVAAGVILLTGASPHTTEDGGITKLPSPAEMPPRTVALVIDVPGAAGTVTRAEFDHAFEQAVAQSGKKMPPKPGTKEYESLNETTINALLEPIWLEGLGDEMGFEFSEKEIEKEFEKLKRENFRTQAEYKKFLKEDHFTREDVLQRVRLQKLSTEIQAKLKENVANPSRAEIESYYAANKNTQFTTSAHGSTPAHVQPLLAVRAQIRSQLKQRGEQEYFADFVKRFNARYRARTVCLPKYADERCSNGPAPNQAPQSKGGGGNETDIPPGVAP